MVAFRYIGATIPTHELIVLNKCVSTGLFADTSSIMSMRVFNLPQILILYRCYLVGLD